MCKEISGYFSNYNRDLWYYYFTITERASILFLLLSTFKYTQKICWLSSELLIFFLGQDIIDRVFFNIKEINLNDYVTIGILGVITLIKYINYKNKHNDNIRKNTGSELV